jgi:FKBP-type peptidyl-prolyl cis-trans isomerase (trigger factor)
MTKTTITKKPNGSISFDLTLSAKAIAAEYSHVLAEVAKTAEVKGFRKGKAPLNLVEAQSDSSKLYSHVLDHLLSPAYSEVIHEHKLVPLIEPQVTPKSMEQGKDWVMSVEVASSPEVEIGDYEKYVKSAKTKHAKVHKHEAEEGQSAEQAKHAKEEHELNIIFDALLDNAKLEVAPLLVDEETKSALSRLAKQLESLKLSVEDYAKSVKKTTNELVAEYKKSAEANLKLEFILQKLIELKNPKVEQAEIDALKPPKGQEIYAKYVLQKRKVLDFLSGL